MKIHLAAITLWVALIQTGSSEAEHGIQLDGTDSVTAQYDDMETEDRGALEVYKVLEASEINVLTAEEEQPTADENVIQDNCYEGIEKTIPIMFQEEWNDGLDVIETVKPIEYVFVRDGGEFCFTSKDCTVRIHNEIRRKGKSKCGIRENFYVGGDGKVYEGRGWNVAPFWYLNGFRNKSLTVQFLGSYATSKPSPDVKEAFETAMEIGIWQGYLSKNYKIISMSGFLNDGSLLGEELNQNLMKWNRWVNERTLYSQWQYILPSRLRFVLRPQWGASHPEKELQTLIKPVEYILISESGNRCFTRADCIARVKAEQANNKGQYGDLLENFYIGDGGEVYEGRGWDAPPHWYIKGIRNKYMSVQLIGSFQQELPSEIVINSLKLLIQTGVWLGKIVPDYTIFSLRDIYMEKLLLGKALYNYAIEWSPWYKAMVSPSVRKLESFGLLPLISRMDWSAQGPKKYYPHPRLPISYVLVGDGGDSCFHLHDCIMLMQEEQSKYRESYGDVIDNFYIGGDGNIYEGKGWTRIPHWNLKYFNRAFISVKFIGTFQTNKPSALSMLAFNYLMKFGILSRKISPDYKIYSLREIYNDSSLLGDEINSIFWNGNQWANDLATIPESQMYSTGMIPVLSREDWNASGSLTKFQNVTKPFECVVVGDKGNRCFTTEECELNIQSLSEDEIHSFGDVPDNFYIGEDGSAIEGLGWSAVSKWSIPEMSSTCIFIRFFGRFQDILPSEFAIISLKRLLQYGTSTGKLSNDYKILSIRQLFNDSNNIGDMLSKDIMTWQRWSEYIPFSAEEDFSEKAIFVPRNGWNAISTTLAQPSCSIRESVIVFQAGKRCFTQKDCISRLQTEQNKTISRIDDLPAHFYIADDGRVYEGRGWSMSCYYRSNLLVAFLGKYQRDTPSPKAIFAFNYLIVRGIISGKLAPHYTLHSMRQLSAKKGLLGDALHLYLKESENYSEKDLMDNCYCKSFCMHCYYYFHSYPVVTLSEVFGYDWVPARSDPVTHPLAHISVKQGGKRCYDFAACSSFIASMKAVRNSMKENFYVGDDGNVYEGQGWDWRSGWDFKGKSDITIVIQFIGIFETETPSSNAMEAFEDIIREGISSDKLPPDVAVGFMEDKVGSKLKETINAWIALNEVLV